MRKMLMVMGLAALAAGCGSGEANEDAFNTSFDASFKSSCVSSAVGSGAPEALATKICDCTLEGINEKFSTSEKMTMSTDQAMPIMNACMQKLGPK